VRLLLAVTQYLLLAKGECIRYLGKGVSERLVLDSPAAVRIPFCLRLFATISIRPWSPREFTWPDLTYSSPGRRPAFLAHAFHHPKRLLAGLVDIRFDFIHSFNHSIVGA
jgi:hypothetical protein